MSEQTTPVRTDELAPGDRVWHPFDAVCFTVSHTPRPETGLHFEGEPGLRVTGTSDRGETVHVDVAPGYKWYRGPGVVAPSSAPKAPAPLVVNTADGACWTRRAVTEGGVALYALADVCSCPEFVMATFEELAARGIVGSAFALPMPGGPEPEPKPRTMLDHGRDALRARMTKDDLRLVLENVITYAASLETERHRTNEWADDAAEALRRDRDRIAELEDKKALADRERVELQTALERALAPFCEDPTAAAAAAAEVRHHDAAWFQRDAQRLMDRVAELEAAQQGPAEGSSYPPALPWARLMDHEDLADFLDELAASAITHATAEVALAEVEETCGRWRLIAEAQHAHNTAPGPDTEGDVTPQVERLRTVPGEEDVTPQVQKLRALLAGQREQAGGDQS